MDGHDTPELEIFGMDGVPQDDLQRHLDGLPIVPYNKTKMILGDASILPLLAAQKVSVASQLAESKNLIVQGGSVGPMIPTTGTSITSPPTSATKADVIVSPPTSATTATAVPDPYQQYYQYNPYAYHPQYAAYYQQYYAQQYAAMAQNAAVVSHKPEEEIQTKVGETKTVVEKTDENPLENLVEIIVPPVIDSTTNRVIPGIVFTVPSIDHSVEELRSRLKKYNK